MWTRKLDLVNHLVHCNSAANSVQSSLSCWDWLLHWVASESADACIAFSAQCSAMSRISSPSVMEPERSLITDRRASMPSRSMSPSVSAHQVSLLRVSVIHWWASANALLACWSMLSDSCDFNCTCITAYSTILPGHVMFARKLLQERNYTHTHPFSSPLSGTTRVSRYLKGKTNLDFTKARDSEWQWHQLGHMQVCKSAPHSRHTTMPAPRHSVFLQAGCPSCRQPTASKHWRQYTVWQYTAMTAVLWQM